MSTTSGLAVDTSTLQPRFLQVAGVLAAEIAGGDLTDRLPTERSLCERFSVSRVTLRRALSTLAESHLVASSWGRGWYVIREPLSEPPNALLSFTELAERRGLTPSARVLGVERRPATLDEADVLRIAPGSPLLVLDRLRLMDAVPTVLQRSAFSLIRLIGLPSDLNELDLGRSSIYRLLEERCGVIATRADYVVEARPADPQEAELLGVPVGSALLRTAQVTFDQHGQPFEQHWSIYPHDRYRFQATLVRPTAYRAGLQGAQAADEDRGRIGASATTPTDHGSD